MLRSQRSQATNDAEDAIITICDPFHDDPYTPISTGHSTPSIVRVVTRTITVQPTVTNPMRSFCVGGFPVGAYSTDGSTAKSYIDSPCQDVAIDSIASLPYAVIADAQFVGRGTISNTRQFGPVARNIDNLEGSLTRVSDTPTNPGQGRLLPPIAPVFVVTSDATTFKFDDFVNARNTTGTTGSGTPFSQCVFGDLAFYEDGPTRLIGCAYEIHNVSSALNKQGTLTVGDSGIRNAPCDVTYYGLHAAGSGTAISVTPSDVGRVNLMSGYPRGASELIQHPNSKQWAAEHGVYAIYPPTGEINDFEQPQAQISAYSTSAPQDRPKVQLDTASNVTACKGIVFAGQRIGTGQGGMVSGGTPSETLSPTWTFVDGMNAESVYTITVRLIYETIPYFTSPLVSLARMPASPTLDFCTKLHSVFHTYPPYCMVAENAKGSWWKKVVGVAKKAVPIYDVVRPLLPPPAQAIGDKVVKVVQKLPTKQPNPSGVMTSAMKTLSSRPASAKKPSTPKKKKN